MQIDLVKLIESLPSSNFSKYGVAVSFGTIMQALKSMGFGNKDALTSELERLEQANRIEVFRLDEPTPVNLIVAVRVL